MELNAEERELLAHELLASLGPDEPGTEEELRTEVIRRARAVRDGSVQLVDGPSSLRAIREARGGPRLARSLDGREAPTR